METPQDLEYKKENKTRPSVGIGFPVYNNAKYLPTLLDSLLSQMYPNIVIYILIIVQMTAQLLFASGMPQMTIGFNKRINKPSCQCIHNKIMAVPRIVKHATNSLLTVVPINVSSVSRSVTICVTTVPLPRLSYSDIEMRCR